MKIKSILTITTFLALSACGGGGGNEPSEKSNSSETSSSVQANTQATSSDSKNCDASTSKLASLSDLVGVWEEYVTLNKKKYTFYTVTKSDGTVTGYYWQNSGIGDGRNCFLAESHKTQNLGNGKFTDNEGNVGVFTISCNSSTSTFTEDNVVTKRTAYKSDKKESDFKPICS